VFEAFDGGAMKSIKKTLRLRRRYQKAFSLPETIIALLILSIAILAIAGVPIMSSKLMLQTTHREQAMFLAVQALDALEAQPFNVSVSSEDVIGSFSLKAEKPVFVESQPQNYIGKATVTWRSVTGQSSLTLERRMSKFSNETRRE
jgi:prepilin-type N-terminal cleavage/methylation domain-containing protein